MTNADGNFRTYMNLIIIFRHKDAAYIALSATDFSHDHTSMISMPQMAFICFFLLI